MPALVRFGPFELDLSTADLHRNGRKMRLPEQQFQILEMLLSGQGNLVSREEIRKRLWPNDTIVEFDRSITLPSRNCGLRWRIRRRPRFIETVARRGYRILVAVQFPEAAPPADAVRKTADGSLVGKCHTTAY
jgi:eukaryotic-like serine/threonine-protein kinase